MPLWRLSLTCTRDNRSTRFERLSKHPLVTIIISAGRLI